MLTVVMPVLSRFFPLEVDVCSRSFSMENILGNIPLIAYFGASGWFIYITFVTYEHIIDFNACIAP